jgi:hypothetical protein
LGLIFNEVVTIYPAAGYRLYVSGALSSTGYDVDCWSCAVSGVKGYHLGITSTIVFPFYINARALGFPVRCVQNLLIRFAL